MNRWFITIILFVTLAACFLGCEPPPRAVRWGSGNHTFPGGYSVINTYVDKTLDSLIFFDMRLDGFASYSNLTKMERNSYAASFQLQNGNKFDIVRDIETGEMRIDGRTYLIARGPVFLCAVAEGSLEVTQIAADIAGGYVEFYFPHDTVDMLVEENEAVRSFLKTIKTGEKKPK